MRFLLAFCACVFALCAHAAAETLTWTGAANGTTFNLAGNWSPAVLPGPTHDCVIGAGAGTINAGTVSVHSITTARNLTLSGCSTVTVTGGIELQSGAIVQLNNSSGCTGLIFSGAAQALSGSGSISIVNGGGKVIKVANSCALTIEAGVSVTYGPGASGFSALLELEAGSSIASAGTISVKQSGLTLAITGAGSLTNTGSLKADAGTLSLRAGSWTNSGQVQVAAGAIAEFGGSFLSLGPVVNNGGSVKLTGSVTSSTVVASVSTGTITISDASLHGCSLQSSDGTGFRTEIAFAGVLLDGCTLAGDLINDICGAIEIENGLTLDGGSIVLDSDYWCGAAALLFAVGDQAIGGQGSIILRNSDADSASIAVLSLANLTLGSGVSLVCPSDGRGGAKIQLASTSTLSNFGRISMALPAKTLWIAGGTFVNNGTLESTAGQLFVDPDNIQNFNTTNGTLTGGRWLGNGGGLSLGARNIRTIAPETEVALLSTSGNSAPNLSLLTSNQGTLRIANRSVGTTPVGGTFTNSGLIEMSPEVVFAVTGALTLQAGGTVRTAIKGTSTAQFGRMQATGAATVAGHLRGSFVSPYAPTAGIYYTPFVAGSHVTGAFSDICFDENPQHMGVVPSLLSTQLRLQSSLASGTAPEITLQPASVTAAPNAVFTVAAAPTSLSFGWKKDGQPLTNGPTPGGSIISGSTTKTLTIQNAGPADVGAYTVTVSNACGDATSDPAQLSICAGDLNHDALVDDADFQLFVSAYNILDCADPAMPASCPADLNRDGFVDDADFQLFVPAYDALLCP
ncbi:MAG: immunoglobulin domain-containing protein [Planctomycetes bacterium]|nr:immunoglobulin domain-containing protein [Planctomycetota bacterium]